jgi:carboxyl-terminal processing protease
MAKNRLVYGGGGIMPDVFVALDTTDITDYYSNLIRGGHVNAYSLEFVNSNREQLKKKYPDVKVFIANFNTDASFMEGFFGYVSKEDPKLTFERGLNPI